MNTQIDARGLACPEPVIRTREALKGLSGETVDVLVDNEGAVGNLQRLARSSAFSCSVIKEEGHWRVSITGEAVAKKAAAVLPTAAERLFLVVGTDSLGRDEALGSILMIRFFETMVATGNVPHTIFFINTGVRLTTVEDAVVPTIRKLAEMGVQIFSCGTCLKFYDLEPELAVGGIGSIDQVVDGVTGTDRVVWV